MVKSFISMSGTQVMGTLQPWLSFFDEYGPCHTVILQTPQTEAVAKSLAEYARTHGMGEVEIIPISTKTGDEPDTAASAVVKLARNAEEAGGRVCLNLDGGLNYLINDCVLALEPYNPVFIQSTRWRCMEYDSQEEIFRQLRLPRPFTVEELLDLQGVPWSRDDKNERKSSREFWTAVAKNKISLPQNRLENVTIGGIFFELVWNPGNNRLCLLKNWLLEDYELEDKVKRLAMERDFTEWSTNRKRSGQLYDKQVFALVTHGQTRERLMRESGSQITAAKVKTDGDMAKILERWFQFKAKGGKTEVMSVPENDKPKELGDDSLVVCMGRNIVSTLLAIGSHKPAQLALCYTKGDAVVRGHVENVLKMASQLGISDVQAIPFEIDGIYPKQVLPAISPGSDVNINIAPGSKGQGAMLTWWGKKNGCTIWSLDNGSRQCRPLHNPQNKSGLPYDLCDPDTYFQIAGMRMLNHGLSEKELEKDMPAMDSLLEFMRAAIAGGKEDGVLRFPVKVGNAVLFMPDKSRWVLRQNGNEFTYMLKGGQWLERLCAIALLRAGATHARVNCTMGWNENIERDIIQRKNPPNNPHRLELDVVGVFQGDLVLISCKSNPKGNKDNTVEKLEHLAAQEARSTGANLGRFGLRMLAHMHCSKAYAHSDGKVMVIGWRELCQPRVLREKILELRSMQRTTI